VKFKVILADPPWHFELWGEGKSRTASAKYAVQETDWISSLPIQAVCEEDCCLFLWTSWPKLYDAIAVIEGWGFTYKTLGFDWVKKTSCNQPRINLGYWTRANSEPCLLATRGKPKRLDKGVGQVIISGLGEHSEKPEEQYTRIERLVEGPYLELFHRPRNGLFPPRPNWHFLGNECDGMDMKDALIELANK
jgi:N6-adenosine-specific RNA methylase IME4